MLDLSPIDLEVETAAKNFPRLCRNGPGYHYAEVAAIVDPPQWAGVSWLFHWTRRSTNFFLRKACSRQLDRVATELQVSSPLEALLPDFGFAAGDLAVPYGRRGALRLRLEPDNHVATFLDDRPVDSLPAPLARDDADAILQTRSDVARLKKEIRRATNLLRLYLGFSFRDERQWTIAEWRSATANPVFRNAMASCLFAAFGTPTNRLRALFALDETGEPVTLDHTRFDLARCEVVRLADSWLLSPALRRDWGSWFADHQRVGARLDRKSLLLLSHHRGSRSVRYGHWSNLAGAELRRVHRAFTDLGWEPQPWPPETAVFRGSPWFTKELAPGGPWATLLARGEPHRVSYGIALTPTPFPPCSQMLDWLKFRDVPAPLLAEVDYDLRWADRIRKVRYP